jgi:hypothetical protein
MSASLILAGLIVPIPPACGEQPIDITYCVSLVGTVVSENEEMTVTSFDFKGIARSNLPDKAFDNLSLHGVGVGRVVAGKTHNYGYIKFLAPDGDYVVTENLRDLGDTEGNWKFLQGTGKWKGIQGGGKLQSAARGRPILKDTLQGCIRMTGKYELGK